MFRAGGHVLLPMEWGMIITISKPGCTSAICLPATMSTSEPELSYTTGDLFAAPANSILVHACNTKGSWGAGIALAFKARYPAQFKQYQAYCREHGDDLIGTCLLIPGNTHDIACLFTSRAYGRRKDSPSEILSATRTSVQDLIRQNINNKPLHAWYVPSHHYHHVSNLCLMQPLQLWKVCCSMGRHRGCFEGA